MRRSAPFLKICGAVAALAAITPSSLAHGQPLAIDINTFFPQQRTELGAASGPELWGQPTTDDFVFGPDGVVSSVGQPPALESLSNEIGYDKPIQVSPNLSGDIPDPGIANVAECGPSPFSVDQIQQMVTEAAERHKVDISLAVAIAYAESRFDRERNSPAGARGAMQLMPGTADRFGVIHGAYWRHHPSNQTRRICRWGDGILAQRKDYSCLKSGGPRPSASMAWPSQ